MIAQVRGKVIEILDKGLVVETGGIGYAIFTPASFNPGAEVTLHTHLVIRDDAHELYGFEYPQEKLLFIALIGVSGVGPKTALQMLSMYPLNDLVQAIRNGDAKTISLVPGIGKKSAEKIIIDLKDKLSAFGATEKGGSSDLVEALLSLGFKEGDIKKALPSIDPEMMLEKQITTALQILKK